MSFKGFADRAKEWLQTRLIEKAYLKLGAAGLIIVLALADYSAMYILFSNANFNIELFHARLYSFTFALCLEGIPTYLGFSLAVLKDKTRYKIIDRMNARIGFSVALAGILFAFALAVFLRYVTIDASGGKDAYLAGTYVTYPLDFFLMWSPILTSILAFASSWFAFVPDNAKGLERETDLYFRKYLREYNLFLSNLHQLQNSRSALWTALTDHRPMPLKLDVFRQECFARVRSKLIENSINAYSTQVKRFIDEVESILNIFMQEEVKSRSTIPLKIEDSIKLNELIEQHDSAKIGADVWRYDKAEDELIDELIVLINNEIRVKQHKAVIINGISNVPDQTERGD